MTDSLEPVDVLLVDPAESFGQAERALAAVDDDITISSVATPDAIGDHDPAGDVDGRTQTALVRLRLPDTPVIVVAVDPSPTFVSEAFDNGAADVISVPPTATIDGDISVAIARRIRSATDTGGGFASHSEQLDSLLEYLPHQVFIKDDRGRIAEASAAAAEEYGLTREQMIGLTDHELFTPEYAHELWQEELEIMETEEPVINRTEHYSDAAGRDKWINITKAPRYDSDDEVVGLIGTSVDVTERMRQEKMVNALHAASRDLVSAESREEIAEIAVDIADDISDLPVVQVSLAENDSVEPVCSQTRTDQPSVFEDQEEWFERAFEAGRSQFIHLPADGSPPAVRTASELDDIEEFGPHIVTIPLGDHGVLGFGATGEPLNEFGVDLADVLAANVETTLSRMTHEEALRARERELARQNERLEEFAGIVSHDIRNPLSVAKGYLPQTDVDEEIRTEISRSLDRMGHLTEELLTLARKGQIVGETAPVAVRSAARTAWQSVSTDDAVLEVAVTDDIVDADRERLVELLENLFRNAVEHGSTSPDSQARQDSVEHGSTNSRSQTDDPVEHGSTSPDSQARQDAVEHSSTSPASHTQQDSVEHGSANSRSQTDDPVEHGSATDQPATGEPSVTVTVGTTETGFYVEDDGPGIPDDEKVRVFDQGFTTDTDGTGFGLYIVQALAEAHGWSVSVADAERETGARFEIDTSEA